MTILFGWFLFNTVVQYLYFSLITDCFGSEMLFFLGEILKSLGGWAGLWAPPGGPLIQYKEWVR